MKREEKIHVPLEDRGRTESWRPERTGRAPEVGFQLLVWEDGFGLMAARVWEARAMGRRWAEQQAPVDLKGKSHSPCQRKWVIGEERGIAIGTCKLWQVHRPGGDTEGRNVI